MLEHLIHLPARLAIWLCALCSLPSGTTEHQLTHSAYPDFNLITLSVLSAFCPDLCNQFLPTPILCSGAVSVSWFSPGSATHCFLHSTSNPIKLSCRLHLSGFVVWSTLQRWFCLVCLLLRRWFGLQHLSLLVQSLFGSVLLWSSSSASVALCGPRILSLFFIIMLTRPCLMEKGDILHPIAIVLDGSNYTLWSRRIKSFLIG